jgi:hypothetical protein
MGFIENNARLGDGMQMRGGAVRVGFSAPTWRNFTKKTYRCSRYEEGNFSVRLPLCPCREMAARERRLKDKADLFASANKDAHIGGNRSGELVEHDA